MTDRGPESDGKAASAPVVLQEHDVHVWFGAPEAILAATSIDACRAMLDAEETARYTSFRFDRHRDQYLAGHVLLRTALSRYAPAAPDQWIFASNRFGRPEIAGPASMPRYPFNLSHTSGLVVCGVSGGAEIGVDVEAISRDAPDMALARRYFAAAEYEALRQLPHHDQRKRFFTYWTLKEAYVKARGIGLSLPLDGFAFESTDDSQWTIEFRDGFEDSTDRWAFSSIPVDTGHIIGVAIARPLAGGVELKVRPADWLTVPS